MPITQDKKDLLQQLLPEDVMRESVTYQALVEESERQGLTQGIQQEAVKFTLRQLRQKMGSLPEEVESQIRALPVERLEELGLALLEFESLADLTTWLDGFNH